MAVLFLASLVVAFSAINGLPAPAAGLTAAAVAGNAPNDAPALGDRVAGPTHVTRATPEPNPRPRPTAVPLNPVLMPTPTPVSTPTPVPTPAPVEDLAGYVWPLKGRLTLGFEHSGWGSRLVKGERFHDGIDIATSCGDRIRAGVFHERLGRALWTSGKLDDSLSAYQTAVEMVPTDPPTADRARVLAGYAQVLMLGGRYSESLPIAREANHIAKAVSEPQHEGH